MWKEHGCKKEETWITTDYPESIMIKSVIYAKEERDVATIYTPSVSINKREPSKNIVAYNKRDNYTCKILRWNIYTNKLKGTNNHTFG